MSTARQLAKQLLSCQPMVVHSVTWIVIHGIEKEEPLYTLLLRRCNEIEIKTEMRDAKKRYYK